MASQASDRLRSIVEKAKQDTPVVGLPISPSDIQPDALVDKHARLPDPLALSRLYQSSELSERLPEDVAEVAEQGPNKAQGWEQLPPVAGRASRVATGGEKLLTEPDQMARPSMTPAEMRAVMAELQDRFQVSDRSYETYELSHRPLDDVPVGMTKEERDAAQAAELQEMEQFVKGTWLYFVGAGLVIVVIVAFIVLATSGPFRPPAPQPTPSASAAATH